MVNIADMTTRTIERYLEQRHEDEAENRFKDWRDAVIELLGCGEFISTIGSNSGMYIYTDLGCVYETKKLIKLLAKFNGSFWFDICGVRLTLIMPTVVSYTDAMDILFED